MDPDTHANPSHTDHDDMLTGDGNPDLRPRVLLLVEDNPADADTVRRLLDEVGAPYQVVDALRLSESVQRLAEQDVDVAVLDLGLPDSQGVQTVTNFRRHADQLPVVVLTGSDDEDLALACIDAGAQDCLIKSELTGRNLQRAIGHAISRLREAQIQGLQQMLQRYQQMSSAGQTTSVTAALAQSGALARRVRDRFEQLVNDYVQMLDPGRSGSPEAPREVKEAIVTLIGDANGGPRDLLDVHLAALERVVALNDQSLTRLIVVEARLLALEMMGLLVDYYRVGHRRRAFQGSAT